MPGANLLFRAITVLGTALQVFAFRSGFSPTTSTHTLQSAQQDCYFPIYFISGSELAGGTAENIVLAQYKERKQERTR